MIATYKTIAQKAEGYFYDRKSKFYAFAFPVQSHQQVKQILKQLHRQYHDARHIAYAYVLGYDGQISQSSDAGEPAGSAGAPILRTIKSFELTNILVAVIRYFGGKKLGIPGLINAYSAAAEDALTNARVEQKFIPNIFEISCNYSLVSQVMNLLSKVNAQIIEQNFDQGCSLRVNIPLDKEEIVLSKLNQLNIKYQHIKNE